MEPTDQATLAMKDPPFLRSRSGKRRAATKATRAGVISTATASSDTTTSTGATASTTSKGAMTAVTSPRPQPWSQPQRLASNEEASSKVRIACTDASQ